MDETLMRKVRTTELLSALVKVVVENLNPTYLEVMTGEDFLVLCDIGEDCYSFAVEYDEAAKEAFLTRMIFPGGSVRHVYPRTRISMKDLLPEG